MIRPTCILVALACAVLACPAVAQTGYPTKPIRFIVPFPPGGGTDIVTRLVANKLNETHGWQFVVDNRSGAGGSIGLEVAARAAPDGYTIVTGQTSNLTINPALYSRLGYDSFRDFAPVTLMASSPVVVVVGAKASYKSIADLIEAAKARPDQVTYATSGNGGTGHLTSELLQRAASVKLVHVPYKGATQVMPDLISGRLNVFFTTLEAAAPQLKAGTIRLLAVTSGKRVPSMPDAPTIAESGYKGLEATNWHGAFVPARTPAAIITRLSSEITRAVNAPDVQQKLAGGAGPIEAGPAALAAQLKADYDRWGRIVREAGIKAE